MSRKAPTYAQLSMATKDLREATKITQRRQAAEKLVNFLSNQSMRAKLAKESYDAARASGDPSPYSPLRKAYANAIRASLHAANQAIGSSKSKSAKQKADLVTPFKLLFAIDQDSDQVIAAWRKERRDGFDQCEPFTFEAFDRYRNTHQKFTTHAGAKEIKDLLIFLLEVCLEREDYLRVAEVDLMRYLQKMCARPDYVVHFHPRHDVIKILKAVKPRLDMEHSSDDCRLNAAKALYNLVHNLTVRLGIQIHAFVTQCLALVVDWVRESRETDGYGHGILASMYGVAVDILSTYPEQCIHILARDDMGRDLFGYARKCWGSARDANRDVLVAYFSAHLYVCEVAGNIQGLLPGDLGDVKNASIDKQKLGYLMEMLLSKKSLELFSDMRDSPSKAKPKSSSLRVAKKSSVGSRGMMTKRVRSREQLERFHPLSRRQRCWLELCVRILRCFQRIHLADSERAAGKHMNMSGVEPSGEDGLSHKLLDECFEKGSLFHGLGSSDTLDDEDISSSPWMRLVGHVCLAQMAENELGPCSSMIEEVTPLQPTDVDYSFFSQADSVVSQTQSNTDERDIFAKLPMMKAILNGAKDGVSQQQLDDSAMVTYLQLIGACAEVFPRGECWSSSNKWFKTDYSPFDDDKCATFCNASTSKDLASIIYCLSLILKRYGGADGNIKVQNWTMVCLLKLTEASHICCRYSESSVDAPEELAIAWQCVWNQLLHSDLRYHSYTANVQSSTAGELVLMLLTQIVQGGLTEKVFLMKESEQQCSNLSQIQVSSFIRKYQGKIWNLPAFWSGSELSVSAPLELATAVIHSCGLIEGGEDTISARQLDFAMEQRLKLESSKGRGRRFRLASFCLQFLLQAAEIGDTEVMRRIVPFATSLLCALLDGKIKVISHSSFSLQSLRQLKMTEHIDPFDIRQRFQSDDRPRTATSVEIFWEDSISPFSFQFDVECNYTMLEKFNGKDSQPSCPVWSRFERCWLKDKFSSLLKQSASHSPLQTMLDVKDFVLEALLNILESPECDEGLVEDDADRARAGVSLPYMAAYVKCIIAVALCGDNGQRNHSLWSSIEDILHCLVKGMVSNTEILLSDGGDFSNLLIEVVGIARFMRYFISTEPNPRYMKNMLPTKLSRSIYKNFEGILKKYVQNREFQEISIQSIMSNDLVRSSSGNFDSDGDESNLISSRKISKREHSLSLSSESEIDDSMSSDDEKTRKRKRKSKNRGSKKMRTDKENPNESDAKIDSKIAFLCASVMVILDPTLATTTLIAEAIIWPGESHFEPDEPHDCLVCLALIYSLSSCQKYPSSDKESEDSSTLSLCLDIILRYRDISRSWSPFHLMGFQACAAILKKRLYELEGTSLSGDEIGFLAKILVPEGKSAIRSLNIRPSLRLSQLEATIKCFLAGSDEFLKEFSDIFRSLVMTSLCDQNVKVRRGGIRALGAALTLFPFEAQKVIAKKALAQFPPKPNFSEDKRKGEKFSEWVEKQIEGVSADMADFELTAWHESRKVIEGDKIRAVSAIGGMTKDSNVAEVMIQHLVYISLSPKLRTFAFLQLEILAAKRSYQDMEELLRGHEVNLMMNWFESERALMELPITLTSPSLVRSTLRLRCSDNEISSLVDGGAADEFITQHADFILPYVFIAHSDLPQNEIEGFLSSLSDLSETESQNYFVSIILELSGALSNGDVVRLLKVHFHDIYAHLLPMLAFESKPDVFPLRSYAMSIIDALSSLFKNVRGIIKDRSDVIILQLLQASVRKAISHDGFDIESKVYIQGIPHVAAALSGRTVTNQDFFKLARTSATECLLITRELLQRSDNEINIDRAWGAAEAIIEIIQESPDNNEIGFCIVSLLSVLVSTKSNLLRRKVLMRLKEMLNDVTKREVGADTKLELAQILNKIVSTITNVHEEYQTLFVDTCIDILSSNRISTRMGLSFLGGTNENSEPSLQAILNDLDGPFDETPNAAVGKFGGSVDRVVTDCLSLAYQILEMVLDTSSYNTFQDALIFVDPFPESKMDDYTLSALSSCKEEYSLAGLLQTFEDKRDERVGADFQQKVSGFIETSSRFRATKISAVDSYSASRDPSSLPSEERSLLAALRGLQRDIEERCQDEGTFLEDNQLLDRLRRELFDLCDKQFIIEIQIAALKCIGLLVSHSDLTNKGQDPSITNSKNSRSLLNPLPEIYSSAFELVAKCVQSDNIDIAITAKETAKKLFTTHDGAMILQKAGENQSFFTVLKPLIVVGKGKRTVSEIPDEFKARLLSLIGKNDDESMKDNSWCWNDELWKFPSGGGLKYEEWIKYLVCSIIICCYVNNNEGKGSNSVSIRGKSDFFPQCLGLCARDQQFASTLFPGLIYDLLNADKTDDFGGSDGLTWDHMIGAPFSLTNQTLTRCFQRILKPIDIDGSMESKRGVRITTIDGNAVKTIAAALDTLRIVTENSFIQLPKKRNMKVIKGRAYPTSRGGSSKIPDETYNSVPESPSWRGRRYGLVLHLTGIELSSAYAFTKDFASALYYAEVFADSRLGTSGQTFECMDKVNSVQTSLSGFGVPIDTNIHYGGSKKKLGEDTSNRAVTLYHILHKCYSELHEEEAITGLEEQLSSVRFERPECFGPKTPNFANIPTESDILNELIRLDTRSQLSNGSRSSMINSALALSEGLSYLGMRNSSMQVLLGTGALSGAVCSDDDYTKLSNRWAEETWRLYQWDSSFFTSNPPQVGMQSQQTNISFSSLQSLNPRQQEKVAFHLALKNSISSLVEDDFLSFHRNLRVARESFLEDFSLCVGSSTPIIELNGQSIRACMLNELEELGEALSGSNSVSDWISKFCSEQNILSNALKVNAPFRDIECAMSAREIFVKIIFHKFGENSHDEIAQSLRSHMWNFCSLSRSHSRPHVAMAALERLRQFDKATELVMEDTLLEVLESNRFSLEEARITQCMGNMTSAVRTCKEIIKSLKKAKNEDMSEDLEALLVEAQMQCAEWSISYPTEPSTNILKNLLEPAATIAKGLHERNGTSKWSSLLSSTNFALANFVANLYDATEKRVESHEWKMLRKAAAGRKQEYDELDAQVRELKRGKMPRKGSKEYDYFANIYRARGTLKIEVESDKRELDAVEKSVQNYRNLAIESYGTALQTYTGETNHSTDVFRLVSLWFGNCNIINNDINMDDLLAKIPSYHFVPLVYQIFSRIEASEQLSSEVNSFQSILKNLVTRICIDHPYHGIVQLIALANGNNVGSTNGGDSYSENVGASKSEQSQHLLVRVKKHSGKLSELVDSYFALTKSIIEVAMAPTNQLVNQGMTKRVLLSKLQNKSKTTLDNCLRRYNYKPCILTKTPRIQPGNDYGDGKEDPIGSELVHSYDRMFSLTDSGIHRPKIVKCISSKENEYIQLIKGEDDIRQDAVLQQVFSTVNLLLHDRKKNSSINKNLRLITYSCVPLSPAAGVLEWVEDTMPMRDYLMYAHNHYYPGEWDNTLCTTHFMHSPKEAQRETLEEIYKHFSPAFRFFFLEKFGDSHQLWHQSRMAYVRSCAVNSMVGHVLGIGDRHSSNILLSQKTGEVVHIDFGIVFEQGKVLQIPETVPFRLTRDMIDGMGPTGTKGSFTAAAIDTMDVLRENSSTLLTVLSAVVSDPLYKWCVNPLKARQRQREENASMNGGINGENANGAESGSNSILHTPSKSYSKLAFLEESENDAATRTIAKINEKLSGYEEGTSGERQTVEGQVRLLINAATDIDNLSKLFYGWAPWL